MKAQMSLEMMAYLSMAGISILYSAGAVSSYYAAAGRSFSEYEYSDFVESVNTAVLGGYTHAVFYVPEGMCNSTAGPDYISTRYGTFYFAGDIRVDRSILCNPGESNASITYSDGYAYIA